MIFNADATVFFWINGLAGKVPFIDDIMSVLASDYLIPLVFALIIFALWFSGRDPESRWQNQRAALCALIAMGFANLAVEICNDFYDRLRPFELYPDAVNLLFYQPTDPSLPANTAAIGFAFAMGTWLVNRRVGLFLFTPALLLCFARVFVGVHYPLDIIAGAAIGIVVSFVALLVLWIGKPIPTLILKLARRLYLA
ncbi:MAG: phosphatase PAP2 family protein [Dehalococcoidia bacterium]|nr:MAG: phosphatase PAP2 family protein [Dehalococcoidia bacterium]